MKCPDCGREMKFIGRSVFALEDAEYGCAGCDQVYTAEGNFAGWTGNLTRQNISYTDFLEANKIAKGG